MRIPVFAGEGVKHLGFVRTECELSRHLYARNVDVRVNDRGNVIRIDFVEVAPGWGLHEVHRDVVTDEEIDKKGRPVHGIGPNSVRSVYEENLPTGPLMVLKKIGDAGEFERWDSEEKFDPRRFNPDRLVSSSLRPYGRSKITVDIAAV